MKTCKKLSQVYNRGTITGNRSGVKNPPHTRGGKHESTFQPMTMSDFVIKSRHTRKRTIVI